MIKPSPPRIVIVGGGLAGLATAVGLVGNDLDVTLIESRPRLGGRAGSFTDPIEGDLVDNCQHVSMGCCTNLADFCRRVGIDDLFRRDEEIVFLGPDRRISRMRAGKLPAPFHLTRAFLGIKFLSIIERLRVARGMASLCLDREDRPGENFADWLTRHGQTTRTINLFWGAVLVSALNERLEQMDVGHARKVMIDGFLRNRDGYRLELPLAPLGELYGTRLETWLAERSVSTRLTTGVREVEIDPEGAVSGVVLRTGERIPADFVVLSVPFDRAGGMIPEAAKSRFPWLKNLARFESSPITGVHLWFDREVCPLDHAATLGRLTQWVFNHSAIQGRRGAEGGQYLQIVISASYDLTSMSNEAILHAVLDDLREMWPATAEAKLTRKRIVTEHGATFAVRPGVEAIRPPQRTEVDGFFLAGDWTATGWPATMEGATRSGYLAAEGVLADLDRPTRLLRPDLPQGRLARGLLPKTSGGGRG